MSASRQEFPGGTLVPSQPSSPFGMYGLRSTPTPSAWEPALRLQRRLSGDGAPGGTVQCRHAWMLHARPRRPVKRARTHRGDGPSPNAWGTQRCGSCKCASRDYACVSTRRARVPRRWTCFAPGLPSMRAGALTVATGKGASPTCLQKFGDTLQVWTRSWRWSDFLRKCRPGLWPVGVRWRRWRPGTLWTNVRCASSSLIASAA
mmetsp:Transcript_88372/g.245324  ORF Transcript_88372/g.245324 Transcript_88372/m.245324 type:complete len:204 (-) Transcript_88372:26-637(-)